MCITDAVDTVNSDWALNCPPSITVTIQENDVTVLEADFYQGNMLFYSWVPAWFSAIRNHEIDVWNRFVIASVYGWIYPANFTLLYSGEDLHKKQWLSTSNYLWHFALCFPFFGLFWVLKASAMRLQDKQMQNFTCIMSSTELPLFRKHKW